MLISNSSPGFLAIQTICGIQQSFHPPFQHKSFRVLPAPKPAKRPPRIRLHLPFAALKKKYSLQRIADCIPGTFTLLAVFQLDWMRWMMAFSMLNRSYSGCTAARKRRFSSSDSSVMMIPACAYSARFLPPAATKGSAPPRRSPVRTGAPAPDRRGPARPASPWPLGWPAGFLRHTAMLVHEHIRRHFIVTHRLIAGPVVLCPVDLPHYAALHTPGRTLPAPAQPPAPRSYHSSGQTAAPSEPAPADPPGR